MRLGGGGGRERVERIWRGLGGGGGIIRQISGVEGMEG